MQQLEHKKEAMYTKHQLEDMNQNKQAAAESVENNPNLTFDQKNQRLQQLYKKTEILLGLEPSEIISAKGRKDLGAWRIAIAELFDRHMRTYRVKRG